MRINLVLGLRGPDIRPGFMGGGGESLSSGVWISDLKPQFATELGLDNISGCKQYF